MYSGKNLPEHAIWINQSVGELQLIGMICPPDVARARADTQYAYINQRFVRDKGSIHAIRTAHADVLHHARFPAYVLFLDCPARAWMSTFTPPKPKFAFAKRAMHQFIANALKNHWHKRPAHASQQTTDLNVENDVFSSTPADFRTQMLKQHTSH